MDNFLPNFEVELERAKLLTSETNRRKFIQAYSALIKAIFSILYSEFFDLDKLSDEVVSKLEFECTGDKVAYRFMSKDMLKKFADLKIKNKEKLIERLDYVNNEIQRLTSTWGI